MKFYVCSRFGRQAEAREIVEILEHEGHPCTSSWVHQVELEMFDNNDGERRFAAHSDKDEVLEADAILYLSEDENNPWGRGGRHVEFGIAIAAEKQLFILGDRENLFHYLDGIIVVATVTDLIEYLREDYDGSHA